MDINVSHQINQRATLKWTDFHLRLHGEVTTITYGESGGSSGVGSSQIWSKHCFSVELLTWPGFGTAPVGLEGGRKLWFAANALDIQAVLGLLPPDAAAGSVTGLAHVEVLLRLPELDFTDVKLPWEAVLMPENNNSRSEILLNFGWVARVTVVPVHLWEWGVLPGAGGCYRWWRGVCFAHLLFY